MGLKLRSLPGTPNAPPEIRPVPDGQVAVVAIGALPWVPALPAHPVAPADMIHLSRLRPSNSGNRWLFHLALLSI
jgi:hypothetical protein